MYANERSTDHSGVISAHQFLVWLWSLEM